MQFNKFKITAPAKINLCLHITGKTSNNYHLLSSLVIFTKLADILEFETAENFNLEIKGLYKEQLENLKLEDNLVSKASKICLGKLPNIKITLEKNLPIAAGIGGGSSDAAATIIAMQEIFNCKTASQDILKLGADIPICLTRRSAIIEGIGEIITPVSLPKLNLLLVNPNLEIKTADIFKNYQIKNNIGTKIPTKLNFSTIDELIEFLKQTENQLEKPAINICPEIANIIDNIKKQEGCLFSRMSGSGATCFGIFDNLENAKKAQKNILEIKPNYWAEISTSL